MSFQGDDSTSFATVQIYAFFEDGNARQVRALAPSCEVQIETSLEDLGHVDSRESLQLIEPVLRNDGRHMGMAIAAIAMHAGDMAMDRLVSLLEDRSNRDAQKDSLFWMGQVRIAEAAPVLRRTALQHDDAELRQQAVFAYSQSTASDRHTMIIDVIEDRRLPYDDRKHALFWLAQTDSSEAISYLESILMDR